MLSLLKYRAMLSGADMRDSGASKGVGYGGSPSVFMSGRGFPKTYASVKNATSTVITSSKPRLPSYRLMTTDFFLGSTLYSPKRSGIINRGIIRSPLFPQNTISVVARPDVKLRIDQWISSSLIANLSDHPPQQVLVLLHFPISSNDANPDIGIEMSGPLDATAGFGIARMASTTTMWIVFMDPILANVSDETSTGERGASPFEMLKMLSGDAPCDLGQIPRVVFRRSGTVLFTSGRKPRT